jgi:hypothetical protein
MYLVLLQAPMLPVVLIPGQLLDLLVQRQAISL